MAICKPMDLPQGLPPGARLGALDVSGRRLGLALADPGRVVASPVGTVARTRLAADLAALEGLVSQAIGPAAVAAWLVGLPVRPDGRLGPEAQAARAFAHNLARLWPGGARVALWDERHSTNAVERALAAAQPGGRSRRRIAGDPDALAAAWILQGFLDRLPGAQP